VVYHRELNVMMCDDFHGILLSITNKMQHYTIFFIIVNALHVSGGFSARHWELKNCTHSIGYMPDAVYTVFELLMMDGETA
jgi:hypothetical protein